MKFKNSQVWNKGWRFLEILNKPEGKSGVFIALFNCCSY
jgi:hypothetical protein